MKFKNKNRRKSLKQIPQRVVWFCQYFFGRSGFFSLQDFCLFVSETNQKSLKKNWLKISIKIVVVVAIITRKEKQSTNFFLIRFYSIQRRVFHSFNGGVVMFKMDADRNWKKKRKGKRVKKRLCLFFSVLDNGDKDILNQNNKTTNNNMVWERSF